jgi:hypothetical protein
MILRAVSCSHSILPQPVDPIVDLAMDGDVDAESALLEPAVSCSCDDAPIDITPSSFTSSSAPRPTYPSPGAPATNPVGYRRPLHLRLNYRDVSTLEDPSAADMTLRQGQ